MNDIKQLASRITVAASVAILVSASAFADNRHSQETQSRESRRSERIERNGQREQWRQNNQQDRGRGAETFRSQPTYRNNGGNDRNRDAQSYRESQRYNSGQTYRDHSYRDNRSYRDNSYRDNRGYRDNNRYRNDGYRNRTPYFAHGRVSRYERFGSGYRVWIGGVAWPFFIPEARFRLFPRFHVGLDIRLGGYYNPGGYYDYYDGPYDGGSVYGTGLRGVVEAVDLSRGTLFVRDERTDAFVRVVMRGYDRLLDDVRIGDMVDLSGDWTRTGVFQAYRIENLNPQGGFYR